MTQPQNAGAQPDGSPYESDEQPSKRKLVIAAAAAFVLLAGGGGYLLLGGGGDAGPDTSLAVPKKVGAKTSPVPTPA
ncbi:MAG: hypothetical protein JWL64_391, partial [Frankiales bacterium]|nr:hypothetical protein [Frankiales bacterium]